MLKFLQNNRVKKLNDKLGKILFVLGQSSDQACLIAHEGLRVGLDIIRVERERAREHWDDSLCLILANKIEKQADALHHSGKSDYAKGLMLSSIFLEVEVINTPEAGKIKEQIQNVISGFQQMHGQPSISTPTPINITDKINVCKSTSTIMATFLQEMDVYKTPLKLMRPPVLAYLYGWCDATVQLQKPSSTEGLTMMMAMFDDIYGRIIFADGVTFPETAAIAYKQALQILKGPNSQYASWIIMGGNELNDFLSSNTPPIGILEALEAAI